jgi:hypothetical protein
VSNQKDLGKFGDLAKLGCISWDTSYWIKFIAKWVSEYIPPMAKVTRFIVFLVFRYAYLFILHLVYLSCLVLQLIFTFV